MSDNQVIPEAAVEAAVAAVEQETYGAEWARRIAIIAVQAAAPHMAVAAHWSAEDESANAEAAEEWAK